MSIVFTDVLFLITFFIEKCDYRYVAKVNKTNMCCLRKQRFPMLFDISGLQKFHNTFGTMNFSC